MTALTDDRPPRRLPALEPGSAYYWTAGAEGRLLICRCGACGRYIHPPTPLCTACGDERVSPEPVSGRGRVATFTVNHQQWIPRLPVPYVIAAVELVEQAELYVLTNIVGCPAEDVRSGMEVEVVFEPHGEVFLPMFQPIAATDAR